MCRSEHQGLADESGALPGPDQGGVAQVRKRKVRYAVAAIGRAQERKQSCVLRNGEGLPGSEQRAVRTEIAGKYPQLADEGAGVATWKYAVLLMNTVSASEAWLFGIDDVMENFPSSHPISHVRQYEHQARAFGTNNFSRAHKKTRQKAF